MNTASLFNVTPEEREMLVRSEDYGQMVEGPGWKRLIDFMAAYEDLALGDLRKNLSSDPHVAHTLTQRWRQRSQCLQAIQDEVLGAIALRTQWLEEMKDDPRVRQLIELEGLYGNNAGKP